MKIQKLVIKKEKCESYVFHSGRYLIIKVGLVVV